jgi:RHH-type transcriptional regulator, proline utilization regulon repressor / proline dehydrogenase / delta 1-pyrroline-5-carboxylate dehydrogenase
LQAPSLVARKRDRSNWSVGMAHMWDRIDADKFLSDADAIGRFRASPGEMAAVSIAASAEARILVEEVRARGGAGNLIEATLNRVGLTSPQGLALMRICEAVLRTPDHDLQAALIREQLDTADWSEFAMQGGVIEKVLAAAMTGAKAAGAFGSIGSWTLRAAVLKVIRDMADIFIMGQTIDDAMTRAKRQRILCSFDMLGEGARTAEQVERYVDAYATAILAIAKAERRGPEQGHGISIKLSALHPRYESLQEARIFGELYPRLESLARNAAAANIALCLDAEDSDRLVLSLQLLEKLAQSPNVPAAWRGLGIAVQAYQKRAPLVVDDVIALARSTQRCLMVRLVKGAYWDGEIKHAQSAGHPDFPVFTHKEATDVSYLACAEAMIDASPSIYPQFATHNAHTLVAVANYAMRRGAEVEFQRLHGMGDALYALAEEKWPGLRVRVYSPVGSYHNLLPYLVRRLLENGSNTSFVRALRDTKIDAREIVADPIAALASPSSPGRHQPLRPPELYPERKNSMGIDLTQAATRRQLLDALSAQDAAPAAAVRPTVGGRTFADRVVRRIVAPADQARILGEVTDATGEAVDAAFNAAVKAQPAWNARGGKARGDVLRKMGTALERNAAALIALLVREAGKTFTDAVSEVREAADFCYYYASLAGHQFGEPISLPGPAGERNELSLQGRGVAICISPWNFPLAIFTGQIATALAAGCAVIAKPAEQTPLVAAAARRAFIEAGLPADVLLLMPGDGAVGARLVSDSRHAAVAFTGSNETAEAIAVALVQRHGHFAPLVAETGGINAIFADASALPEHLLDDVILSAFGSAGQRCSSARLLIVQDLIADDLIKLISGAMDELKIGDPASFATDIGPIIDADALERLEHHVGVLEKSGRIIKRMDVGELKRHGHFFGPVLAELPAVEELQRETFGPIIHVVRYRKDGYADAARALAATGYGLTLGVHSRLKSFQRRIRDLVPAGNVYVNRSIIGAVVGTQPFGGLGRSGTGPKAGGPHALLPFATERVLTVNLLAEGADPALLAL